MSRQILYPLLRSFACPYSSFYPLHLNPLLKSHYWPKSFSSLWIIIEYRLFAGWFLLATAIIHKFELACLCWSSVNPPIVSLIICIWCSIWLNTYLDRPYRPPPWPNLRRTTVRFIASWPHAIRSRVFVFGASWAILCCKDPGCTIWLQGWVCFLYLKSSYCSLEFPYLRVARRFYSAHTSFSSVPLSFSYNLLVEYRSNPLFVSLVFMAPSGVDKGKKPMAAEDPAPVKSNTRKGSPEGQKLMRDAQASLETMEANRKKAEKKFRRKTINRERLITLQGKVQENISVLNQSSLFATIIGDPMEAKEVRKKVRYVWKFITGGFQLIPLANNWFGLRFDVADNRTLVWDNRPYHVSGQLILLRPWRLEFDPWTESMTNLDLWIRFPGLPPKYVHDEIIRDIVEQNELGQVIRVVAFNSKGARYRYPRVCVAIDITLIAGKNIFVVNEDGKVESFPIWFEDFPSGCGSCGSADHSFEGCPSRNQCNALRPPSSDPHPDSVDRVVKDTSGDAHGAEWVKVVGRKHVSLPPPTFGNSKIDLLKCFGKNVSLSSDSSSSKSTDQSGDVSTTTLPVLVPVEEAPPMVMDPADANVLPLLAVTPNDEPFFVKAELQPDLGDWAADDDDVYGIDEEEFLDEILVEDGLADPGFTQADFEAMLVDVPPSVEFILPDLSRPDRLAASVQEQFVTPVTSPAEPSGSVHKNDYEASKSESGKRKIKVEDGDSACSALTLMGGSSKKGKHV